jgi:hypothetical protein
MSKPIQPDIPEGSVRYFTNARGTNLTIPLRSVWKDCGYVPRVNPDSVDLIAPTPGIVDYDNSSIFVGTNKTAQWWYYNDEDAEFALKTLRGAGHNCIRVFLDYYLWYLQKEDFLDNIRSFLTLCDKYKIRCQFVIWEQFDISDISTFEPQNRGEIASGVIPVHLGSAGGGSVWGNVPLLFETSSVDQAHTFWSGTVDGGKDYIDALVSATSSYQSMWSFDVQNESGNREYLRYLTSATSQYVKDNYPFIKTTFGDGGGYNPNRFYLFSSTGGVSGSVPANYEYSSTIDFASMHTYGSTKYLRKLYIRQGVSGAEDTGTPGMFNESSNYPSLELIRDAVRDYHETGDLGGMIYQAFCERNPTQNPFNYTQGLFFDDGTCRQTEDVSAYIKVAEDKNWFSRRQLNKNIVEKTPGDSFAENGFTSGTSTGIGGVFENYKILEEHSQYLSEYSGLSEDMWTLLRDAFYGVIAGVSNPTLGEVVNGSIYARNSYRYPDRQGTQHSNVLLDKDPNRIKYNLGGTSGFTMYDVLDSLYTLSSLPDLSSFTSDQLSERNDQVLYMSNVLMFTLYSLFPASGIHATADVMFDDLLGSEYDDLSGINEVISPQKRLELSSAYSGLGAVGGFNTIMPAVNTRDSFKYKNVGIQDADVAKFSCHENGRCLYVGGSPPASPTMSDIDWDAYTTFYSDLIAKTVECVKIVEDYGENVNSDFRVV